MTDGEGRPITVEVYPGNTGDPTTVADQVEKLRDRFQLSRVVLVGDRGMLTQPQIDKMKTHPGLGWITALTSVAIRGLLETGALQLSLLDETNLAEITSPDYPGERLMVCHNPLLEEERGRKRRELLQATEQALTKVGKQVERRKKKPLKAVIQHQFGGADSDAAADRRGPHSAEAARPKDDSKRNGPADWGGRNHRHGFSGTTRCRR
jgi:transposase